MSSDLFSYTTMRVMGVFLFFFQAEDGIRDIGVTGVQTCALPILLENFKEVIEGLEGTNESAISHRVNDTLRVLTAFSVVILPLTLIESIWGMNVHVSGESVSIAFYAVHVFMIVVLIGMLAFFRRRGFL